MKVNFDEKGIRYRFKEKDLLKLLELQEVELNCYIAQAQSIKFIVKATLAISKESKIDIFFEKKIENNLYILKLIVDQAIIKQILDEKTRNGLTYTINDKQDGIESNELILQYDTKF